MGIDMDLRDKNIYEFINWTDVDEKIKLEIISILRLKLPSNILKLPWDNVDEEIHTNSIVPETSEAPNHWSGYGSEEGMSNFEVVGTTAPMMTSPISGTIAYGPQFVQLSSTPYDWQAISGNTFPSSGVPDAPNAYQYIQYSPVYQATTEVMNASPSRDNERRGGRGRNRKNDSYNRTANSTDMQQPYLVQPGQFNPMTSMCHTSAYIRYPATQVFIPSVQSYNQPQIHTHHNNHPQYSNANYSAPTTANLKQHSRQSSGQTFYNQESSKTHSNVYPKAHEKGHNTVQQPFRQVPRNTDDELPKKIATRPVVTKNGNSVIKNGDLNAHVNKSTADVKATAPAVVKACPAEPKVIEVVNDRADKVVEETPVSCDAKPVQDDACPLPNAAEVPPKSTPTDSKPVPTVAKVNGEEIKSEKIVSKPEVTETKVAGSSSPLPATPQQSVERTFASILKKKNSDTSPPAATKLPVPRYAPAEVVVADANNPKPQQQQQQQDLSKRPASLGAAVTTENESASKIANESLFNERKKLSIDSAPPQMPLCDPNAYRMGEFLLVYQMDKQTVSLLPRGLTNRSNYCYINSILQALLACPPFFNLLRALPCNKNYSKSSTTPLIDNMVKFVNEFVPIADTARLPRRDLRAQKKSDDSVVDIQAGVAFEPSYVYTMLKNASCASVFSIEGRQEDAEEFLSCLLNGISDEMLELMKQVADDTNTPIPEESSVNYGSGDEEWKVMGPRNKGSITRCTEFGRTPLSDIFRGQLRSRIIRQGEQSTDNVQPFFTLQLDIENAESVKTALEILVGKDPVEGMTCGKTKQQIKAWKQVTLEELPVILILHLKWFDYKLDGCSKIVKRVSYGIDLKVDSKLLSLNVSKKLNPKQKQYKLFAVTYHDGKEATKGHYVTDAFHVGYGAWVRYDDSSVKGISENDVLNPTSPRVPYLLYYRRCDTIGNNAPNNTKTR